jgi:hypothetical protein
VKTWRRLQDIGAVPVRNSVYALPNTDACREDFEWLRSEIAALGGEATVFAADALDREADAAIEDAFRRARDGDYAALTREAKRAGSGPASPMLARAAAMLRARLDAIRAIDFARAPSADAADEAVRAVEARVLAQAGRGKEAPVRIMSKGFANRRWVTRPRPGVDRMASAWLIRRFIDPKAAFAFVAAPAEHDVPFDMYTGEFSHEGGRCTFEVLAQRFAIADPTVTRLAQIVHDIDMKDNRYDVPETAAVARMVEGLRQLYADDTTLLAQGVAMFEALARSFESTADAERPTVANRAARTRSKRKPRRRQQ